VLYRFAKLGEADYRSFSITVAALKRPSTLVALILPSVVVVWITRHLRWSDLPQGRLLKTVVLLVAGTLAVGFALYEPSWFYGRDHIADRVLLIGLVTASCWRPMALLPLTVLAAIMASQFALPIGQYTWNDKRLIFDVLLLFCFCTVSSFTRRRQGLHVFVIGTGILLASWFVVAGVGKIGLGWVGREELDQLTRGAHANGWLGSDTALRLADFVGAWNWLLVPLTIAIEIGALLVLAGRRPAIAVLMARIGLHVIVFATSGIFFWKWIVLEAALILLLVRTNGKVLGLRPSVVLVAVPFIVLSPRLFGVTELSWYDTPYTVTFELETVGSDGQTYRVDRDQMAPYDVIFAQNRFDFLVRSPLAVGTYGATANWAVASRLLEASGGVDIAHVEARYGQNRYDPQKSVDFDRLVRARFGSDASEWPIHSPHHIWTGASPFGPRADSRDQSVREVRVRMRKVWWDGERFRVLADCVVRVVPIDPAGTSYGAPPSACRLP